MRIRHGRFWVLATILIIINTAGIIAILERMDGPNEPGLRVIKTFPTGDPEKADRFGLLFDNPVVAPHEVGQRLERSPFVIEPEPQGDWTWSAPDRLDFLLDGPLPPGREYRLEPAADFEDALGRHLAGTDRFTFRTAPLALIKVTPGLQDRTDAHLVLCFNQPVAPSDLAQRIHLYPDSPIQLDYDDGEPVVTTDSKEADGNSKEADGKGLKVEILTLEPADVLTLRVRRPEADMARLVIDAGLTGYGGNLPLEQAIEQDIELLPVFTLVNSRTGTPSLTNPGGVDFLFFSAARS